MKKYCMSILFFVVLISFSSCITFRSKEINISNIKVSSKGYSFILKNDTDNEIYYYGYEENTPWISLQFQYKNEWLLYACCHTVGKLKLYSLPKDAKRKFYFPGMDCIEGWRDNVDTKKVRIVFPYSYNQNPIKPNYHNPLSQGEKWNNAYGCFTIPIKP